VHRGKKLCGNALRRKALLSKALRSKAARLSQVLRSKTTYRLLQSQQTQHRPAENIQKFT